MMSSNKKSEGQRSIAKRSTEHNNIGCTVAKGVSETKEALTLNMYTDILDQVTGGGSGGTGRGGRSGGRSNARSSGTADSSNDEIIVRFKAGRVELQSSIDTTSTTTTTGISDTSSTDDDATAAPERFANKENQSKFQCVSRPERGEVRLVKSSSSSQPSYSWQWYSRTRESVEETIPLLPSVSTSIKVKHTFERVTLPSKKIYEQDRVYVWTQIPVSSKKAKLLEVVEEQKPKYRMYWMQDADPSTDDSIVTEVNQFFSEVATAVKAAAIAATTATSSTAATTSQVDALSSILENLGMPQTSTRSVTSPDAASGVDISASASATTAGRNQLTLADLQGAMASIQQQQQRMTVGPPLQDLVTSQSIDAIMNNPDACQRLLQYLPAEQQSVEYLRENLTSSSMQSTLRSLTQMLIQQQDDDRNSSYTEYSNIIANFQLDPQDGEAALLQNNNPIEAFLNCIIASVEREKDSMVISQGAEDNEVEEEAGLDTNAMDDDDKKDNDDDVQMNE